MKFINSPSRLHELQGKLERLHQHFYPLFPSSSSSSSFGFCDRRDQDTRSYFMILTATTPSGRSCSATGSSKSLSPLGGSLPFQKPFLKKFSENFRTETNRRLKSCNCSPSLQKKYGKDHCLWCPQANVNEGDISSEEDDDGFSSYISSEISAAAVPSQMKYSLIMAKQMVGGFHNCSVEIPIN